MKIFSIQHPRTRNYIYEWIFHQALKREGILSLRYKFINVTLNGQDLGVYALEEHFDKRLIEYNKYENLKPQMSFSAKNIQEAASWQKLLKSKLIDLIGGISKNREKLNSRVVKIEDFETYTRETILFDSAEKMKVFGNYCAFLQICDILL